MRTSISRVVRVVAHELRIRRDVTQLEQMSDRMLADIGVSRSEIPGATRGQIWRRFH